MSIRPVNSISIRKPHEWLPRGSQTSGLQPRGSICWNYHPEHLVRTVPLQLLLTVHAAGTAHAVRALKIKRQVRRGSSEASRVEKKKSDQNDSFPSCQTGNPL